MLDLTRHVWFYDSANRKFDYRSHLRGVLDITAIIWQNDRFALCYAANDDEPLLINLTTGEVLNRSHGSWVATNDIGFLVDQHRCSAK